MKPLEVCGIRRRASTTLSVLAGVAIGLVLHGMLNPPLAAAAPSHLWDACDSDAPPAQQCARPRGLAADLSSGYIYVVDQGNARVIQLSPWGEFLRAWGWDVVAAGPSDDTELPEDQFEVCVPSSGDICKSAVQGDHVAQFVAPASVALDSAGNVYVYDVPAHRVQKFSPTGEFLLMFGGGVNQGGGSPANPGNICTAEHVAAGDICRSGDSGAANGEFGDVLSLSTLLAISPDDKVYVGDVARIQRFDTGGLYQGQIEIPGETVQHLAVDGSGNLYVAYRESSFGNQPHVQKVAPVDGPVGPPLEIFRVEDPHGLAVAPTGDVYVFDAKVALIRRFDVGGTEKESFGESLGVGSIGLAANAVTGAGDTAVYFANVGSGLSARYFVRAWGPPPEKFEPPPSVPPKITAQYAESVSTDSALVEAVVDPRFWTDATYFVEYGETSCAMGGCDRRVPLQVDASVGGGTSGFGVTVSARIERLRPGVRYFYRFVVRSSGGGPVRGAGGTETLDGATGSFTTFPMTAGHASCSNNALRAGFSAALPDCRAYELVSPLDKNGGNIQALGRPIGSIRRYTSYKQSATDGGKLTYSAATAFGDAAAGPFASQYISTRVDTGWLTHGISPPRGTAIVDGKPQLPHVSWDAENLFEGFTSDLCHTWIRDTNLVPLTVDALHGFVNLYRRSNCGIESYEALSRDTVGEPGPPAPFPPFTDYLNSAGEPIGQGSGPGLRLQGYSADLSHQVFVSGASLLPECRTTTSGESVFFRWLRNGVPIPGATGPTYEMTAADAGAAIQCEATAFGSEGGSVQVANPPVTMSSGSATFPTPPASIAAPTGPTLSVGGGGGQALTCNANLGGWKGGPTFSYQWYRNGVAIEGAIASTYTVEAADVAAPAAFQCAVTGTNAAGSVVKASAAKTTTPAPGGPPPPSVSMGGKTSRLYDLHDGDLELVSILPNGAPDPQNSVAGTLGDRLENRQSNLVHAISKDGDRIFWTSRSGSFADEPGKIYVRVDGETTLPVSEAVSANDARFWAAAANGSAALFTSNGCLYKFDVAKALAAQAEPASQLACQVPGVLGTSEDLSHVYFLSREALTSNSLAGANNLYLTEGEGITLVTTLGSADDEVGRGLMSPINALPVYRASRVTADGRFAAFQALGNLTGYNNVDPVTGKRYTEVYRYSADTRQLLCVSCNPTGVRPRGHLQEPYDSLEGTFHSQVDGAEVEDAFGAAALLPTWERELHPSRALSSDGRRVYFHSYEALVARDTNGMRDVYQWESPGTGSCRVGGPGYLAQNGGCVSLISTGISPQHAEFVDASTDGSDVFISTTSNIHPRDEGLIDIYDARVGGGFAELPPPPECLGDACQSVPAAPRRQTPAGGIFNGPGDLAVRGGCRGFLRLATNLASRVKNLRREAADADSVEHAKKLRLQAARMERRAKKLRTRAKQCKRSRRRARR